MRYLMAVLIAAATTNPSQITFTASSGVPRKLADKLSDTVSLKDFGAACDGVTSDSAVLAAAIAAAPSTGGTIDARSCTGGLKLGSSLTISKAGVAILWPSTTVALGASQILIAVGTTGVTFQGSSAFGSTSGATQTGTMFNYTGTGAAIKVGDSSGDTLNFAMTDCAVNVASAGSAAIGVQLNRAINFQLVRQRVTMVNTANTQIGIDLEGGTNFSGGLVLWPYISGGNNSVYFGTNANASTLIGGQYLLPGTTGTCLNFAGGAAYAQGNMVFGGDCENADTAIRFDKGSENQIFGYRVESITTAAINATSNSQVNRALLSNSAGMTITDSSLNVTKNGFAETDSQAFGRSVSWLSNGADAALEFRLNSGSTAAQNALFIVADRATDEWQFGKDNSNRFLISDLVNSSLRRMQLTQNGASAFSAGNGANAVQFNTSTNAGTGGVEFWSGGASPAKVASIDSSGNATLVGITGSGTLLMDNAADSSEIIRARSGSTAAQNALFIVADRATDEWQFGKDNSNRFLISDLVNSSLRRMQLTQNGASAFSAGNGANAVQFNTSTNSGTAGIEVWGGGASPAKVASIDGSGAATLGSKSRGTCTLNGASPAVCTATVLAAAICTASPTGTTAAAATHTLAVSVTTTTLTVTGANGLTDVVNYLCL